MRKFDWMNKAAEALRPRVAEPADASEETLERAYARQVIDLAMRIAETMLTAGASANDVTLAALQVVRKYGVRPAHVDVTYTSITVSYHRGPADDPLTITRVVRARTTDYTRLQRLVELNSEIEAGLDLQAARARYTEIARARHPYRRSVVTLANGGIAAGVCVLFGASWPVGASAITATMLITMLQWQLAKRLLPAFFIQALGALIVTAFSIGLTVLAREHAWLGHIRPSIVVAAGIVVMLAGMSVVGALQDAIDGFYVTAAARAFEVVMLTLGIVVGITVGLQAGSRVGYGILLTTAAPDFAALHLQLIGAVIIASSYALSAYAGPRAIVMGGLMGLVGWIGYTGGHLLGLGAPGASAVGAALGSFIAMMVSRRLGIPAIALTTATIVPLVPGSAVFRGLLQLVDANGSTAAMMNGASTLLGAAGVGVAIAAGISLGTYFGRPARDTIASAARRLRR